MIFGAVLFNNQKTKIIPVIGCGYRFLRDDSANELTSTNNLGYLRESNYYYIPIGIKFAVRLDNGWSLHPEFECDYFWSGRQKSYLGYVAGYEDITNDQEGGFGYRFSLALKKKAQTVSYGFELFYRYWDIDDSEVTVDSWDRAWIEPANETMESGFNFSISF